MSHTEGRLFVMDLREFGEEQLSISNGQEKRGIVCRIKNEVRKDSLDDEDVANARRLVACWNACVGYETEQLEERNMKKEAQLMLHEVCNVVDKNAQLIKEHDELLMALKGVLKYADLRTCSHDETHRGGTIWEICDSCGAKWADDEGGKPEWVEPEELENARAILAKYKEKE